MKFAFGLSFWAFAVFYLGAGDREDVFMGLCSFLLDICFWSCLFCFCMFLFLLKLERWRQRKCFVELARLIILLGLFWALSAAGQSGLAPDWRRITGGGLPPD
jgi:hypothetical protein